MSAPRQQVQQATVTIEQFVRDLWEATREKIREQLGSSVTPEAFDEDIPPWEDLSKKDRDAKIRLARDETLHLIDRAGYEVRKKL